MKNKTQTRIVIDLPVSAYH